MLLEGSVVCVYHFKISTPASHLQSGKLFTFSVNIYILVHTRKKSFMQIWEERLLLLLLLLLRAAARQQSKAAAAPTAAAGAAQP